MQSLVRTFRSSGGIGEALPSVLPTMGKKDWHLRRAQTVMIAAAPNVGKSALALFMAIRLRLPTLYFSADTDQFTTMLRSGAILTGHSMRSIEAALNGAGATYYESAIAELDYIKFVWDPHPTLEDIDLEVSAFVEVYGEPPALIVVDNLINVQCDDGDEFRGLRVVSSAMHSLSRSTGACVLALHHVTGEFEDGQTPPPRRALHGKISKFPELILTLGKEGTYMGIACVKNRAGAHDPLGGNTIWLYCDLERMYFQDPSEAEAKRV